MEFKVGDTVRILNRVGDGNDYSPIYANAMLKYAGTLTSIKKITGCGSLILDNNNYYWDKKAVKLVNEDKYLHPSELKDGDFIKIWDDSDNNFICIFKEYKDNLIYRHASFDLNYSQVNTNPLKKWCYIDKTVKITYATEKERNLLNEALLKEGYIWDNLTKKLLDIKAIISSDAATTITTNPVIDNGLAVITNSHPFHYSTQNGISTDSIEEKIDKEELNLFPTKKHYQLNFNY